MIIVNIEHGDVALEVSGIYVPEVEAIINPVDEAMPGEPSDFEVTKVMYGRTDILPVYTMLDILDDVIELVIKKIEDE